MTIDWREVDGQYGKMYFCDAETFIGATESEVPVELRRSYENYKNTKKPENMEKKNNRYQTDWIQNDLEKKQRYKATYDDNYGWGVMMTKLTDKQIEKLKSGTQTQLSGGGGEPVASSNIEAALNLANQRLAEIQNIVADIKDLGQVVAQYFAEKGMTSAKELIESNREKARAKADAEMATAQAEDFEPDE